MPRQQPPDNERLEEGLRMLRELGYLQTPVERYVARRVPEGAPVWRVAMLVGLFVGVGGGVVSALLLTVSAVLAEPTLLQRTRELTWLSVDMTLALSVVGFLLTMAAAALLLRWFRGSGRDHRPWMSRLAMLAPPLLAGLYLVDRLGTYVLAERTGRQWLGVAIVIVILTASLAALMTWLQSALFAAARLQWKGIWKPPRIGWQERALPFLMVVGAAGLLVVLGPYREPHQLPRLDEVPVADVEPRPAPLLVLALDGVDPTVLPPSRPPARALPLDELERRSHPVAFWNEVATGFHSQEHGLQGPTALQPRGVEAGLPEAAGDPLLATVLRGLLPGMGLGVTRALDQRELQRPQVWEIAAHAGVRSLAVNWWATYPAARHPRLEVLTDRLFLREPDADPDRHLMSPPQFLSFLQTEAARLPSPGSLGGGLPADLASAVEDTAGWIDAWRLARSTDRLNLGLTGAACGDPQRRLVVAFLGGADVLARAVDGHPQADRILGSYRDELRAELDFFLAGVDREVWTVLSSSVVAAPRRVWVDWGAAHEGGVESVRALAPALLERLDLPVARDMEGRGAGSRLATWGRRPDWSPVAERRASDLERLRSLGYIGGS